MNPVRLSRGRRALLLAGLTFSTAGAFAQAPIAADATRPAPDEPATGMRPPADTASRGSAEQTPVRLSALEVVAGRPASLNGVDRKVYLVGKDVLAAAGSVTQMLQNLPSVEVDLDGNLRLRGSPDVLVLIDGRPSVLMGTNRAAALEQMSADTLEQIEVITTPSAKYKPDGTAGIINLVTRKPAPSTALTGSWTANAGNARRANSSLTVGYAPGRWAFTGNFGLRQDSRRHFNTETRTAVDPATGEISRTEIRSDELWRPLTELIRSGVEFRPDPRTTWALEFDANQRGMVAEGKIVTTVAPGGSAAAGESWRTLHGPQREDEFEMAARFTHAFAEEEHRIEAELRWQQENEREDSQLTTRRTATAVPDGFEARRETERNRARQLQVDYTRPLGASATLELGYLGETNSNRIGEVVEEFATPVEDWAPAGAGRLFRYREVLHAGYATFGQTFGPLRTLAGLRLEQARLNSELSASGTSIANPYSRAYPSLHLKWQLAPEHELQWNYSHRIRRPNVHQLNPFPEYADPTHVRVGNPRLKPEDIHSIEFGYQYRSGDTSVVATAYHRYLTNGIAGVITQAGNGVLQSTFANLETSRSFGFELAANGSPVRWAKVDFSSNTFFETIDAADFGGSGRKSNVSWIAKLGATFTPAAGTLLQLNAGFSSARLTVQGRRAATFLASAGLRREFAQGRWAGVVTVTDLFRSMRDRTIADLPGLRTETVHRHDSPVVYVGLVYRFGRPARNQRDEPLRFETEG